MGGSFKSIPYRDIIMYMNEEDYPEDMRPFFHAVIRTIDGHLVRKRLKMLEDSSKNNTSKGLGRRK